MLFSIIVEATHHQKEKNKINKQQKKQFVLKLSERK